MKRFREQKGFTLIELAIVMVIIGIILGAVLKGQDLIQNARAKKFVTWNREWETGTWSYFDRKGRFPGDAGKDGIIGNQAATEQTAGTTTGLAEISLANFINPPAPNIGLGSYTYYMKLGYDTDALVDRNVIVICTTADCTGTLTADEMVFLESIDTAIDGTADEGVGNVRRMTAAPTLVAGNEGVTAVTEASASSAWQAAGNGLVYYFDRPR